jgi:hypothetical protein
MDLRKLSVNELLIVGVDAIEELRSRGIVRTGNNPIGDFAEYLFCRAFSWKLADNSRKDADAIGPDGVRYQIKARRLAGKPGDRQLGALRNLPNQRFDKLAAVLFDTRFGVARAVIIPHTLVVANAVHQSHTNSWRFILRDEVWSWRGAEDVTKSLREVLQSDLSNDRQRGLNQPAPAKHRQSWLSRLVKFGRVPDRE